jgi:hypothetical protein
MGIHLARTHNMHHNFVYDGERAGKRAIWSGTIPNTIRPLFLN